MIVYHVKIFAFEKKLPQKNKIQKVKGTAFYLPLPLEEMLKKVCIPIDPININH